MKKKEVDEENVCDKWQSTVILTKLLFNLYFAYHIFILFSSRFLSWEFRILFLYEFNLTQGAVEEYWNIRSAFGQDAKIQESWRRCNIEQR